MPDFISVKLLRPQDLLSLEFRFFNFTFSDNIPEKRNLRVKQMIRNSGEAFMMVNFQPQSIVEQTLKDQNAPANLPLPSYLSGGSRLVFRVPQTVESIPLTVNGLLNWDKLILSVNPRSKSAPHPVHLQAQNIKNTDLLGLVKRAETTSAKDVLLSKRSLSKDEQILLQSRLIDVIKISRQQPGVQRVPPEVMGMPGELETSLEIPFRMFLSPPKDVEWVHRIDLKHELRRLQLTSPKETFELWHTRLAYTTDAKVETRFWSEEKILRALWAVEEKPEDKSLGDTTITAQQRMQIVNETSNFKEFSTEPIKARKLFLSSLGGWLHSNFTAAPGLPLQFWSHIQTLGRENYVEVVEEGKMIPFGHKATITSISTRKVHTNGSATIIKIEIIKVTEPVKGYNYIDSNNNFNKFPFTKIEIVTLVTQVSGTNPKGELITKDGRPFKIKAEDLDGNHLQFEMPLGFVKAIDTSFPAYQRSISIGRQKLTLAPPAPDCSTTYEATDLTFISNSHPVEKVMPGLTAASIFEPAYTRITGVELPVAVKLEMDNKAVYASFVSPVSYDFSSQTDKTGGFISPNFKATGLSKLTGVFGGNINGAGDITSYFNVEGIQTPKIFGAFDLTSIFTNNSLPQLLRQENDDVFITDYHFTQDGLKPVSLPGAQAAIKFVELSFNPGSQLTVDTKIIASKKGGKPQFFANSVITNFSVRVLKRDNWGTGLLNIDFQKLEFKVESTKKVEVDVVMKEKGISFGGPLSFINSLVNLIQMDGFSDPPYLDVLPTGVRSGYTLALPNLQIGAFTLTNLGLNAELNLPFTGAPLTIGFRFCERHQPFTLTVGMLGGGGFFGIEADFQGIRQVEASLEFGAAVSLNLGVASGAVSVMGGIYFLMIFEDGANSTKLSGYVRINGAMSVLGLITASLEFYMALNYIIEANKAYGEASLSIKVEVLFFSKTVSIHTSRSFSGSGNDPNFEEMFKPDPPTGTNAPKELTPWEAYCNAFAA